MNLAVFQASLIYKGKARHCKMFHSGKLCLDSNIRLARKYLPRTNTLTYFVLPLVKKLKYFITLSACFCIIKLSYSRN